MDPFTTFYSKDILPKQELFHIQTPKFKKKPFCSILQYPRRCFQCMEICSTASNGK